MPNWVTNNLYINAADDKLQEVLASVKADEGELGSFDFNKLIPMPECLNMTKGSITDKSINAFLSQLRNEFLLHPDRPGLPEEIKRYVLAGIQIKSSGFAGIYPSTPMSAEEIDAEAKSHDMSSADFLELGKKYLDNQLNFGASTWYEWSTTNWGTKWNLSLEKVQDEEDPHLLNFDTAWSAPLPIIQALSAKFPDIPFTIEWYDEDVGNNLGSQTYRNGEVVDQYIPRGGSKEAYELYFKFNGSNPEDHYLRYDPVADTYVFDEELEKKEEELYRALYEKRALADQVKNAESRCEEPTLKSGSPEQDLSR